MGLRILKISYWTSTKNQSPKYWTSIKILISKYWPSTKDFVEVYYFQKYFGLRIFVEVQYDIFEILSPNNIYRSLPSKSLQIKITPALSITGFGHY